MYVCHCFGISDRTIRAAVGAGNRCLDDIARACGAGSGCGGCHGLVEDLIEAGERVGERIHSAA